MWCIYWICGIYRAAKLLTEGTILIYMVLLVSECVALHGRSELPIPSLQSMLTPTAPIVNTISQKRSIESILMRQGLNEANPVNIPLDLKVKIKPNPEGNEGDKSNAYAQLLGELQFVANTICPDITYAINKLASYTANPDLKHQIALKCILRYLAGTKNYGITYKYLPTSIPTFQGFTDMAFADREDMKSTMGYLITAADAAITWKSGKQGVTARSTTEAALITLWEGGQEAQLLRNLYQELGYAQEKPTMIYCDNTSAVTIAKNPTYHK